MSKKKKDSKPTPSRIGDQGRGLFDKFREQKQTNESPPVTIEEKKNTQPNGEDPIPEEENRGRGRPKKFDDNKKKTTVSFQLEDIVWLDRLCADILSNTKKVIDRGDIIRACVEALHESRIDLSHVGSPDDVKEMLLRKLKGG